MTLRERLVHVGRDHAPLLRCDGAHGPLDRCRALPEWINRQRENERERGRIAVRDLTNAG